MSKIYIIVIVAVAATPFFLYYFFADTKTTVPEQKEITIPVADPDDPAAAQCAICDQITDPEPKAQCLQDFACM